MKKLFSLLFNPWLLLILGIVALALVIWIVGPLVAIDTWRPLESSMARWIAIGVIVGLIVLRKLWQAYKARSANAKVVDQLLAPAPGASADPADAELKVLDERFATALQTLKNAKFDHGGGIGAAFSGLSSRLGKRYLYELPWYAIIGAPGSGKTTALVNSGLNFPLAATMREHKVRGVGGTRNCDWWFTDQAVLIDTAGRYTTHDSHRAGDSKAWEGFLGLLKRSRPRQPLNGMLVTVSVSDLLTQDASHRAQHAEAVRQRVQELHHHLGMRFPIYLLVTKSDLLAGFVDYLGEVDKDVRATPWGFTFRMDKQQRSDLSTFAAEFDALERRLTDGLVDRLQFERDPQRRARIYGFPQQFEGLRAVLKDFVDQVFSPSQFEAHPLLRGVYFVSGTQEGTPIDRMLGRIARTYRLERTVVPPHDGSGKSYFLARLLKDVVFAESALAGTDLKWERRRGWLAAAGYAFVALVSLTAAAAWGTSYLNNQRYVARVAGAADEARKLMQSTPNRASPDLVVLLPALEATHDLARAGIGDSVPWSHGFGLYQGRKLDAASQHAYQRMLVDAVLPRLSQGINTQIGKFCRQAVNGRYPFVRASARDVTQEDFARLFAPGGLFDLFFTQHLASFVDTSSRPWSFKQLGGASMGTDAGTLLQFQHAAAIRDTFFRAGGNVPGIKLDFKPFELDTSITQFILDVDGQLVKYAHGPQIPSMIQWPGPGGSKQVRVALSPVLASGSSGFVAEGPWALFRLFDRLQIEGAGVPERFRATFNIEGRKAVFEITASSVRNPFRLRELEEFSCPAKL